MKKSNASVSGPLGSGLEDRRLGWTEEGCPDDEGGALEAYVVNYFLH